MNLLPRFFSGRANGSNWEFISKNPPLWQVASKPIHNIKPKQSNGDLAREVFLRTDYFRTFIKIFLL